MSASDVAYVQPTPFVHFAIFTHEVTLILANRFCAFGSHKIAVRMLHALLSYLVSYVIGIRSKPQVI